MTMIDKRSFKDWFEGSKVVDGQGNPLVLYHGTQRDFIHFRTPAWFTADKSMAEFFAIAPNDDPQPGDSPRVVPVYLALRNPLHTDDWDVTEDKALDPEWRKQQLLAGYDGVIFTSDEGEVEYIAFHPDQIRRVVLETQAA